MNDHFAPPITPDYEDWPIVHRPVAAHADAGALAITWSDAELTRYHPQLLAENDPSPATLHPLSRESMVSPLDLPHDLAITDARIEADGTVQVSWSHGRSPSRFHSGWLRGIGWRNSPVSRHAPVLWAARDLAVPPTFDGPLALADTAVFLRWLRALRDYGVARLQGLADEDGLLAEIVQRIGPIRESNFGRMYTLQIKDDPDSNAFTSQALMQHVDMPTRECPHGLQFLFCRDNTTKGGEGIYVDAYSVAEDLRCKEPAHFQALCEIEWVYNNRSKTSSYKASGPVIERDCAGAITGIRYNTWLRAPLVAPLDQQDRAYRSYRAFAARAQDPAYQLKIAYRPGDLLAFDNRRALHGRTGYDAEGGVRFIEGIYADRDDLHSAIRTLERFEQKDAKP